MTNGTVKFFNAAKGFGFITPEGEGKDIFVMATAVTQSGMTGLKPGQRLSFETVPDTKGPKAVNLKLLAEVPVPKAPIPQAAAPAPQANTRLTVYCDPTQDESETVLEAVAACGQEPWVVDYVAAPPPREDLKNLSVLMRGSDQSLVRKYDPLFRELSLDDRFIGDSEFWTAIFEHPTLINGPILVLGSLARVCRNEHDVRSFLGLPVEAQAAKPKAISGRLAALVNGHAAPPPLEKKLEEKKPEEQKIEVAPPMKMGSQKEPPVKIKLQPRVRPQVQPEANPAPQPETKLPAKSVSKPAKAVKAAKPAPKKAAPATKAPPEKKIKGKK